MTKNWESRQKGLREDLETTNKRLEEQLAENQGKLDIVSEESAKLQKELDTVRFTQMLKVMVIMGMDFGV